MIMKKLIFISMALFLAVAVMPAKCQTSAEGENTNTRESNYRPFFSSLPITYNIVVSATCKSLPVFNADPSITLSCTQTFVGELSAEQTAVFNGVTYYNLDYAYGNAYLREDTLTGRIFRYYPEYDTEYLVCDMSLMPGDTFCFPKLTQNDTVNSWDGWSNVDTHFYQEEGVCTPVDTVYYINGRKVIHFKSFNNIDSYTRFFAADALYDTNALFSLEFIEGIGPTFGPAGYIDNSERLLGALLCVHHGDSLTYIADPRLGCFQCYAAIEDYEAAEMKLYPNPAADMLFVEFSASKEMVGSLVISNMMGSVVQKVDCNSAVSQIDVSKLPSGAYLITFNNGNRKIVKKFVKM